MKISHLASSSSVPVVSEAYRVNFLSGVNACRAEMPPAPHAQQRASQPRTPTDDRQATIEL